MNDRRHNNNRDCDGPCVKAPDSFTQLGYMLWKGRHESDKYAQQALDCLEQAKKDHNAMSPADKQRYDHDLAEYRQRLKLIMVNNEEFEMLHHDVDGLSSDLGYCQITDEDFKKLGAGNR